MTAHAGPGAGRPAASRSTAPAAVGSGAAASGSTGSAAASGSTGSAGSGSGPTAEPAARPTAEPAAHPTAEPADGPERWLNPAEMSAWLAFLEVSHLLERAIEQQLRQDAGLSHAQYEILSRLEAAEGGQVRMSDLAEGIVVSRSGLTYQVTQLEKAGLVRREKCPSDDRGVLAMLTSQGRSALARAAPGHLRVVRGNLIDALTPAQLAALADGLAAARGRLRSI
jgi:DNA-binding MarR family transcriptional regulator